MPILPLCMHITGVFLSNLCEDAKEEPPLEPPENVTEQTSGDRTIKDQPAKNQADEKPPGMKRKKFLLLVLLITNLPAALYSCLIHQRGTVDVMKFLYDQSTLDQANRQPMDVMFLMPCHSTPFHR